MQNFPSRRIAPHDEIGTIPSCWPFSGKDSKKGSPARLPFLFEKYLLCLHALPAVEGQTQKAETKEEDGAGLGDSLD